MMHKMSVETWDEVVNVQMRGPWLMAKAASKYFMQQSYGRIVTSHRSPVWSHDRTRSTTAPPRAGHLHDQINGERTCKNSCHACHLPRYCNDRNDPYNIDDEKLKEIYTKRILLGRYADPEDVAPAFVFFASDDARYITGQLLCVDGGYGMT